MLSKNTKIGWIFIISGGICEIFWVSGLKHADSMFLYFLTAIGICFSFTSMIIACKFVELSVTYSVFVGIGTAGIVLAEMFVFGEEMSIIKIFLIVVLLCGIIGLKLIDKEHDNENISAISKSTGIEEVAELLEKHDSKINNKN